MLILARDLYAMAYGQHYIGNLARDGQLYTGKNPRANLEIGVPRGGNGLNAIKTHRRDAYATLGMGRMPEEKDTQARFFLPTEPVLHFGKVNRKI